MSIKEGSSIQRDPSGWDIGDNVAIGLGNDDDIVLVLISAGLAANTALSDILIGTPVAQALAANSLAISSITASGDIGIYVNVGGHSHEAFHADGSGNVLTLGHGMATTNIITASGQVVLTPATDVQIANGHGLIIGNPTQYAPISDITPEVQVLGTGNHDSMALVGRWSVDATGPGLSFVKGRGATIGSTDIVANDDIIGILRFYGEDGATYPAYLAAFLIEVDDATPASNDIGAAYVWYNMPGGGGGLRETMRLNAAGALIIGTGEDGVTAATGRTLRAPNIKTGGAGNLAGADLTIQGGGLGTGTGDVGTLKLTLPIVAAAGDNLQTAITAWTWDMVASATVATLTLNANTIVSGTWNDLGVVTTVDINGGTVDATAIGATTPAAISGTTFVGTDATDATSATAGALKTAGGLAVAKAAYITGPTQVGTTTEFTRSFRNTTAAIADNTATAVLTFTVPIQTNSTDYAAVECLLHFAFRTSAPGPAFMTSSVMLKVSLVRIKSVNTASSVEFVGTAVSSEWTTPGSHTALAISQFAMVITAGSSAQEQTVELQFTNDLDVDVDSAVTTIVGRIDQITVTPALKITAV